MKILPFVFLLLLAACTIRMGAFSPRRPDIQQHRQVTNADCLGCHELATLEKHKSNDNCVRCHKLVKGV